MARNHFLATITATILMASSAPSNAGLLDFFKSNPKVECKARDADCIFKTALQIDIANFKQREVKQNYAPYAKRAAELMLTSPSMNEEEFLTTWQDAGADEKFLTEYRRQKHRFGPVELDSLDEVAKLIQNKTTPEGEKLSAYLKRQMPLAFEKQGQPARDFWLQNLRTIWKNGWSSVLPALSWLAANDFPVFQAYADQFKLPEGGTNNPYEILSLDAADLCKSGNINQGRNVLDVLENKARNWKKDRTKKAMDRASFMPALIYCWNEKRANAHVDRVLAEMQHDLEIAEKKFLNEKERKFVLGVIRSEVAERMIQPMVIWLHNEGREDDARAMFAKLPPRAFSMTIGETIAGDITAAEFPEQDYNDLIRYQKDNALYARNSALVLEHFINHWNPAFEICCSEQQQLGYIVDNIADAWPSELATKAAEKNLALYEKLVVKKPDEINDQHKFELQLAALEKTTGCQLSDKRLNQYQNALQDYKYDDQKVSLLISYVEYLETEPAETPKSDCIIQE